jgi:hypothetical protein
MKIPWSSQEQGLQCLQFVDGPYLHYFARRYCMCIHTYIYTQYVWVCIYIYVLKKKHRYIHITISHVVFRSFIRLVYEQWQRPVWKLLKLVGWWRSSSDTVVYLYPKNRVLMGKASINGGFSISMFDYRRAHLLHIRGCQKKEKKQQAPLATTHIR